MGSLEAGVAGIAQYISSPCCIHYTISIDYNRRMGPSCYPHQGIWLFKCLRSLGASITPFPTSTLHFHSAGRNDYLLDYLEIQV